MDNAYIVTRMDQNEIQLAVDWAGKEGWNPGINDANCFFQADPQGFFAGRLNGKIIAVGSAIVYDNQFAFCGLYIVDKDYRDKGYGLALTQQRLAYIGTRNAGLDGVTNMLDKYARLGYKAVHNNARYCGSKINITPTFQQAIVPLIKIDTKQLNSYDRKHFPAPRPSFLHYWIHQPNATSLGYVLDGQLCGYGVIRDCLEGSKIGPLFADTPKIADELFTHLATHAKGHTVYLDIPENNPHAKALVKRHQMEKVFETARMYLKNPPNIIIEHIYGITSYELG